jgi:alpha-tubulin suppressor-like RCC1 family protein
VGIHDAISVHGSTEAIGVTGGFCVVRVGGRVSCWGAHHGDTPTEIEGLAGVTDMAVSPYGSLHVVLADGSALETGQFGDTTLTPIPGADVGVAAPDVATGSHHSCALRPDGTVACWGENSHGELGNGTTADSSTPVDIPGLSGVVDIAASTSHTCALLVDGTARCWGRNNEQQLGDGGAAFPESTTPVAVEGLDDLVSITPGSKSTCGIREDGGVVCWGVNEFGQLGDGTLEDHADPEPVSNLTDALYLASGPGHYCAVRVNGQVRCWGRGLEGQLGNLQHTANASSPTTVRTSLISVLGGVGAIAAGNASTCAVKAAGTAHCWGSDVHGLGNGAFGFSQDAPGLVSGITDAVDVALGSSSQCVLLASGNVKCFGSNTYGEIGSWSAQLGVDQATPRTVGTLYGPMSGAVALDSGFDHSCAALADGRVRCWGLNDRGQLGDGSTTNRSTPINVLTFP